MASYSPPSSDIKKLEEKEPIPVYETVLQKHAAFFDINNDGVIYPWETFQGLRQIGCGILLSAATAIFINVGLSQSTRPGKFPSLLLPIEVKNIKLSKHGSDTGAYDTEGREELYRLAKPVLVASQVFCYRLVIGKADENCAPISWFDALKFEEIFSKHAHTHPNALTYDELNEMLKANREPKDFKGRIGSLVEWKILYKLAKDKDGLLQKERIRAVYDGSVFELLKNEQSVKKMN